MLTRRTNVLLTEEDNQLLTFLAVQYDTTKGELIRRAVRKTYHRKTAIKHLAKTLEHGWQLLKNPQQPLNYKQLIDYGRKH